MRRPLVVFSLVMALGGCNQLFGIDETIVVDASPQIDSTLIIDPVCDPPFVVDGDADGDGIPNQLDPCPTIADPSGGVDTDGDGVGDACDPAPAAPGDCLVMFEDFRAPLPACWAAFGEWKPGCDPAAPDALCSPADLSEGRFIYARLLSMTAVRVDARIIAVATGPVLSGTPGVEVFESYEALGHTFTADGVGIGGPTQMFAVTRAMYTGGGLTSVSVAGTPPLPFGPGVVAFGWGPQPGGMTMWFKAVSNGSPSSASSAVMGLGTGGRPTIRTTGVQVALTTLVGYGEGTQCISQ